VFICIKPELNTATQQAIEEVIEYTKTSPATDGGFVAYPGENTLRTRKKSLKEGVFVDERIWEKVRKL
jgi:3-dehydro-L-gulonate 2-dehydrogenase